MKKWNKEEEKYLKDNYNIMQYCDIAKYLNRSEGAIRAKCFDLGLIKNDRWTEEEIQYIKDNYDKMTCKEMAKVLKRTTTSIHLKMKKLEIKKSPYHCNYHYFKNIDSEEKAYWLGFIYADGYISLNKKTNSGVVGIDLQSRDIEHLKKFNKSIDGNYKIITRQRPCLLSPYTEKLNSLCSIRIYSITMMNDLLSQNIQFNKTYKNEFPIVRDDLIPHFIRGYFDGNGCIYLKTRHKDLNYISCNFTSLNDRFFTYIKDYLLTYGIKSNMRFEKSDEFIGAYRLHIEDKESVSKFLQLIYDNATIYLDRKYKRYKEYTTKYNYHIMPRLVEIQGFLD